MANGTVYKRNGKWAWHARIGGKQVKRSGIRTKAEAERGLRDALGAADRGAYVDPSSLTLGAYLNGWLGGLTHQGRRATTIRGYRSKVALIPDALAARPVQDVAATELDALYVSLLTRSPRPLSKASVVQLHAILNRALGEAERKGLVARNVARLASPPSLTAARRDAPELTVWSPTELRAFLSGIEGDPWVPVLHVAALTGLRRSELVGLRWSDVDLDAARLVVRQAATIVDGTEVIDLPKSKRSTRVIDVDGGTVDLLRRHRLAQTERSLSLGLGRAERVFTSFDGLPLRPDSIGHAFARLVETSGLPTIRLHDLRHSHCCHLLAAGVSVKVVSERMGHASVAFTLDTYGHVMPGQQAEAAAAVAALINI